jgi:hypothetical protein
MIEYPSIINSSKAPREHCIAFDKLDGSNFRSKWTRKNGFDVFGTRTQLIDETTQFWGEMVNIFKDKYEKTLADYFQKEKEYRNEREIIVFGEFHGKNSFAGFHENEPHDITFFDVMVGHKNRAFVKPREFVKQFSGLIPTPRVIYEGNLNEELIKDVRNGVYDVEEGVICKGLTTNGAFRGKIWQAKIKTLKYFEKLKNKFGNEWDKYGE